jgi:SAM-dependent methyltransferase
MAASLLSRLKRRLSPPPPPPAPTAKPQAKKTTSAKPRKAAQPGKERAAASMAGINTYSSNLSDEAIAAGQHRRHVGGMWDEMGPMQLAFLVDAGLKPTDRLLDIGCGAMRGGIHFAGYLEPGHYYGTDINDRLLEAALRVEIPAAGLVDRVPAENLRVTENFEADFGVTFDVAFAQSVFSHLPLNFIRLCLAQTAKVMAPGGRFFATFFVVPDDLDYDADFKQVAVTTHTTRDPFHYRVAEMEWAATVADWDFTFIGDWGHLRGQQMALFTRTG